MDHDLVIKYISALGFPIVAAVAMGYALWRIGWRLTESHTKYLAVNTEEMVKQTKVLGEIQEQLPAICRAGRPLTKEVGPRRPA